MAAKATPLRGELLAVGLALLLVIAWVWVLPYFRRERPPPTPAPAAFAVAPPGVGGGPAGDGYARRVAEGVPAPWRPPPAPPFRGALSPDPALTQLGREPLGDWMGYGDPWNPLKALEAEVRPGAATWFRAGQGWADSPGAYEGSSASALSAYMVAT
jgi:hypothetical protein